MGSIRSVWPLLIFTSCAPLCAGAWIVAAFLSLTDAFPQASMLVSGLHGVTLCVILVVALGCSTLHLGRPTKALRAFMRLGNSAVSNEVFMGTLFAVLMILYLVGSYVFAAARELWEILLVFVTVSAALFVVFQSLAYRMRTVLSWNSVAFSVEFAVIALMGGVCFEGVACLTLSAPFSVRLILVVVEAACCMVMMFVLCAQGTVVAKGISTHCGTQVVLEKWGSLAVVRSLALVAGSIVWGCGLLMGSLTIGLAVVGTVLVIFGIVAGRYAFYEFYGNVGLPRM